MKKTIWARIFRIALFLPLILFVIVIPSARPFLYEGNSYYITYRIDGNNIFDFTVLYPAAFLLTGILTGAAEKGKGKKMMYLLSGGVSILLALPMILYRSLRWNLFDGSWVLCLLTVYLTAFTLGVLAVFLLCRMMRSVRGDYRRYLEKRDKKS